MTSPVSTRALGLWSFFVCAAVLAAAGSAALVVQQARAEEILLQLQSGRTLKGVVDEKTSERELWLRAEGNAIVVLRPIAWDRIRRATIGGEQLDADAFRKRAMHLRAAPSAEWDVPPPPAEEQPHVPLVTMVAYVQAEAWVEHFDADVEADGLAVQIAPRTHQGRLAAADGSAEIELIAARRNALPQRIGRWTEQLRAAEAKDDGWRLTLPFQGVQPEFDLDFRPLSLVRFTVNLPGHGTYHATLTDVRIRPYSAVRDRLQRQSGERFLPDERTER